MALAIGEKRHFHQTIPLGVVNEHTDEFHQFV